MEPETTKQNDSSYTFRLPADLRQAMLNRPDVNWAGVLRNTIDRKLGEKK